MADQVQVDVHAHVHDQDHALVDARHRTLVVDPCFVRRTHALVHARHA